MIFFPASIGVGSLRCLGFMAVCILLAATLLACRGGVEDSAGDERVLEIESMAHSLEESVEALADDNAELQGEIVILRREQTDFVEALEAAEAAREQEEEVAGFDAGQERQLAALEEGLSRIGDRLDDLDGRLQGIEGVASKAERDLDDLDALLQDIEETASKAEWGLSEKDQWSKQTDKSSSMPEGTVLERTARLAEASWGEVYYIDSREQEERAILVMPLEPIDGNPLIVSLHGYGGNSADHSLYIRLHERVNSHGFGLLLPNGTMDGEGNRSWNPTDRSSQSGKASADDVAYLSDLVARALEVKDFGPVYFFGYSNGGFMSYHMACKGLPGPRAVASLAGTSYVEDSSCDGAPPVSVLHIHGTSDSVILNGGRAAEPVLEGEGQSIFYAGAQEMLMRCGRHAGCDWPKYPEPYATLNLENYLLGPETLTFRMGTGCAEGINIELWIGLDGCHAPGYGDAFADALVHWLLAQE